MDSKIKSLIGDAYAHLSSRAHFMDDAEFAENWHAIERARFAAFDPGSGAEREMEEKMLGNWDYENGHPL